jgi:Domain of unknown function (DUF4191)
MPKDVDPEKMSRRQQFVATYKMAKQSDRWLGLWLLGAFVVGAAVGFGLFLFLPGGGTLGLVIAIAGGLLMGLLAALVIFGRRAQSSAYRQMEGRPGAAGQALGMLRRGWKTDPMIAFNKQQDVVHRVVGPPGIVLVGEGNGNRLRGLLTNERRKHERVAAEIPIHEVVCGNGEGEVPLPRLVKHVRKLGRSVKPAELTDVLNRLKALDASRSNIPMPKGPVPTSMKGLRGQMRGKR